MKGVKKGEVEEATWEEIGDAHGVSKQRAHQIYRIACYKLARHFKKIGFDIPDEMLKLPKSIRSLLKEVGNETD